MSTTEHPINFFDEPKEASRRKLEILGKYLVPLSRKILSAWPSLWVVDGFAGAGQYHSAAEGEEPQAGSPLIAAQRAREYNAQQSKVAFKCINVEQNPEIFAELVENLSDYGDVARCLHGTFDAHLDTILRETKNGFAFFFLDPFGVRGIEMATVAKVLERPERTTELLIHFSDRSFNRMAGHAVENDARTEVGHNVAASKVATIDAVFGTDEWQPIANNTSLSAEAKTKASIELYCDQLRRRGLKYVYPIPMRDRHGARARYTLVYGTNSPHGVDLMSDIACRYDRDQHDQTHEGTLLPAFEQANREADLGALLDDIHGAGLAAGFATPDELRFKLVPERFGLYLRKEYAAMIRKLVTEEKINRSTPTGIKDNERLEFIQPAQGSLLG